MPLKTNTKEIKLGILNATRSGLNNSLHYVAQDVRAELQKTIDGLLRRSPEYQSLLDGQLKADFGLSDPQARLDEILTVLKNSVYVSVTLVANHGNYLEGGINVGLIAKGYGDILGLASAISGEKINIPWLEWLLLKGTSIVVAGYHVKYDLEPGTKRNSMSGEAIMLKGGGYRVPPSFAGTESDNWISRTFDLPIIKKHIDNIVERSMGKYIK